MEIPGDMKVQGFPSLFITELLSYPPPAALNHPNCASRILGAAVQPRAARSAATVPFSAACPAWNGLVMKPKFSRNPPASAPTTPSAYAVCCGLRPSILAQPTALPNDPEVPVEWKPSP